MSRRRGPAPQIVMVVAAVIAVGALVASLWFVTRGGDDPEPADTPTAAATASPTASESWSWPTAPPGPSQAPTGSPVPGDGSFVDPAQVDRSDPGAVAEAAALLTVSHDTALDESLTDAQARLGSLADPSVLDALVAPERSVVGADWLAVAPYDGYTTPAAELIPRHDQLGDHEGHDHAPGEHQDYLNGEPVEGYEFRVTYQWAGREQIPAEVQPEAQTRTVLVTVADREGQWTVVAPPFVETPVG